MNVSDVIEKCLEIYGVSTVFGYPGGNILELYHVLAKSTKIKVILSRHEQAAVHEAEGFSRASGKVGVAILTSGPGATNTITGIANAYLDNIPLVVICGQVKIDELDKDEFQEIDMINVIKPIIKKRFQLWFPNQTIKVMREAFKVATTGRQGPVFIDLPMDVSSENCDYVDEDFNFMYQKLEYNNIDENVLKQAIDLINKSNKPIILAGGGVISANASESLRKFSEKTHIKIVSSMMGKGAVSSDFDYFYGQVGTFGNSKANELLKNCDLLIVVGCRLTRRLTGNIDDFVPNAKIIQIDIDNYEISKNKKVDIAIVGDAGIVLDKISENINITDLPCDFTTKEDILAFNVDKNNDNKCEKELLFPKIFLKTLSKYLDRENSIVTTEVGQHQIWSVLNIDRFLPRTFITSGGLGTMGFGFPAAIGAYYACPNKQIICIAGDGSFQMNLQEMATVKIDNIPIKVVVMNNGFLGMVRDVQIKNWMNLTYAVDLKGSPDYVKVAEGYDWSAKRIRNTNEIDDAIKWLLIEKGPCLLEVYYDEKQNTE